MQYAAQQFHPAVVGSTHYHENLLVCVCCESEKLLLDWAPNFPIERDVRGQCSMESAVMAVTTVMSRTWLSRVCVCSGVGYEKCTHGVKLTSAEVNFTQDYSPCEQSPSQTKYTRGAESIVLFFTRHFFLPLWRTLVKECELIARLLIIFNVSKRRQWHHWKI